MDLLVTDIETRSDVDLKQVGTWMYSRGLYTGINCAVVNDKLFGYEDCHKDGKLAHYLEQQVKKGRKFAAHNAQFEHNLYLNVLGVEIPPEQWVCTQALVSYYGLPQSLDGASKALNLPTLKDITVGTAAMKALMKAGPHGHKTPEDEPEKFQKLYAYCANDVVVTQALLAKLPPLPATEQAYWEMSFRMNCNGLPVDWFHIQNAKEIMAIESARLDAEVQKLTNGELQSARQTKALAAYLGLSDITQETVRDLLPTLKKTDIPYKLLVLRQQSGLSSLAKFHRIEERCDTDARLRGEFWYFGAHTGRYSAAGAQAQNLPAGVDEKACEMLSRSKVDYFMAMYPKPLAALKKTVRGSISVAEDKRILVVDLSQIEARCTVWFGDEQEPLKLYAKDEDVYSHTATTLFGYQINYNKKTGHHYLERQGGKTAELSLGFAGGIGALERGCKKFKVDVNQLVENIQPSHREEAKSNRALEWYYRTGGTLPEETALALDAIKQRWRAAHPNVCAYWYELLDCFRNGGTAGLVSIKVKASGTREVKLPSGRRMFYRNAKIKGDSISYEGRFGTKWLTVSTLIENVVQACDIDIIRWYMVRAEEAVKDLGGLLIANFHDAYGLELFNSTIDDSISRLESIHEEKPDWTEGLPIGYEIKVGRRLT